MQTALSSKAALAARPTQQRRASLRRGGVRPAPMATAAPEKTAAPVAANGAAAAAKADVASELSNVLKYQLATSSTGNDKLYQSGEWGRPAAPPAPHPPSYHTPARASNGASCVAATAANR